MKSVNWLKLNYKRSLFAKTMLILTLLMSALSDAHGRLNNACEGFYAITPAELNHVMNELTHALIHTQSTLLPKKRIQKSERLLFELECIMAGDPLLFDFLTLKKFTKRILTNPINPRSFRTKRHDQLILQFFLDRLDEETTLTSIEFPHQDSHPSSDTLSNLTAHPVRELLGLLDVNQLLDRLTYQQQPGFLFVLDRIFKKSPAVDFTKAEKKKLLLITSHYIASLKEHYKISPPSVRRLLIDEVLPQTIVYKIEEWSQDLFPTEI